MKKKKIIILLISILLIVGIVIITSKFFDKDTNTQKLAELYEQLKSSNTYLFEMKQNDENITIIAQKDNKTIIDKYTDDEHETTLVKKDNTYLILHHREEYYVYPLNNVEQNFLTDSLKYVIDKPFTQGTEKIIGKSYYYEEYEGSTNFMITKTLNITEDNVKTRFYFDKDNNLAYIKTIAGTKQQLLKIKLQNEVENSVFEIPSNYAENSHNQ